MKIPTKCPHCGKKTFWIIRTEPNFDSEDQSRIEDQIFECDSCHTLFRARWTLQSWTQLVEKSTNPSERCSKQH